MVNSLYINILKRNLVTFTQCQTMNYVYKYVTVTFARLTHIVDGARLLSLVSRVTRLTRLVPFNVPMVGSLVKGLVLIRYPQDAFRILLLK